MNDQFKFGVSSALAIVGVLSYLCSLFSPNLVGGLFAFSVVMFVLYKWRDRAVVWQKEAFQNSFIFDGHRVISKHGMCVDGDDNGPITVDISENNRITDDETVSVIEAEIEDPENLKGEGSEKIKGMLPASFWPAGIKSNEQKIQFLSISGRSKTETCLGVFGNKDGKIWKEVAEKWV